MKMFTIFRVSIVSCFIRVTLKTLYYRRAVDGGLSAVIRVRIYQYNANSFHYIQGVSKKRLVFEIQINDNYK
jgi:hypothetical protein